jgi:hypothetical protein
MLYGMSTDMYQGHRARWLRIPLLHFPSAPTTTAISACATRHLCSADITLPSPISANHPTKVFISDPSNRRGQSSLSSKIPRRNGQAISRMSLESLASLGFSLLPHRTWHKQDRAPLYSLASLPERRQRLAMSFYHVTTCTSISPDLAHPTHPLLRVHLLP